MAKKNVIADLTFNFSLKIITLYKQMKEINKEFILSRQILKSGTSIGANIEEAIATQSKRILSVKCL